MDRYYASCANGALLYDVVAASKKILPASAILSGGNFSSFIANFCQSLKNYVPVQIAGMPKEELARVILVGYFWDQPFIAKVELAYRQDIFTPRDTCDIPAQAYKGVFSGSERIYQKYRDVNYLAIKRRRFCAEVYSRMR